MWTGRGVQKPDFCGRHKWIALYACDVNESYNVQAYSNSSVTVWNQNLVHIKTIWRWRRRGWFSRPKAGSMIFTTWVWDEWSGFPLARGRFEPTTLWLQGTKHAAKPPRPPPTHTRYQVTILVCLIDCLGYFIDYMKHDHLPHRRHSHPCKHACMNTCIHASTHIYIHTYIHTYIHAYIHTYLHIYIHRYIHTYFRVICPRKCDVEWERGFSGMSCTRHGWSWHACELKNTRPTCGCDTS